MLVVVQCRDRRQTIMSTYFSETTSKISNLTEIWFRWNASSDIVGNNSDEHIIDIDL